MKATACSSLRRTKELQIANRELGTIEKIDDARQRANPPRLRPRGRVQRRQTIRISITATR